MDRNLDIDNFERLLKERSDEFRMYPTKRVWYSIYNNIHPGRKWPSIAMSITLIAILLLVGYLNTNNKNTYVAFSDSLQSNHAPSVNLSDTHSDHSISVTTTDNQKPATAYTDNSSLPNSGNIPGGKISEIVNLKSLVAKSVSGNTNKPKKKDLVPTRSTSIASGKHDLAVNATKRNNEGNVDVPTNQEILFLNENKSIVKNNFPDALNRLNIQTEEDVLNLKNSNLAVITDIKIDNNTALNISITNNKAELQSKENIMPDEEKAWVENFALYNRPAPKKWAGKLKWQMYITPSVVYRELKNTISTQPDINKEVLQHPSFGVEIGGGILYPVFKGVNLKTGIQFNFTRYNADGFANSHPVATSITLTTATGQLYQGYRSTPYSNNDGITPLKLHNETYQISLPLGMDVKLAGNDNLQWNIGATIQPSYVVGGKSYLISSDKRNYVKETDLINRWNLDAGFETFISYKTDNGFTLQFGPQFRKQIFTTNSKQYTVEEKLTNYGFKFGISKLIK